MINLDIAEGVHELKGKAKVEAEKDDTLAAEGAVRILTMRERKQDVGILKWRLDKLLKANKAEIKEELHT